MFDWWLLPLSGALHHHIEPWASWHARCMVLGWAVLLPLGALTARYLKITPGQRWPQELDNKAWWHAHLWLQWAGVALMSLGALLAWNQGGGATTAARVHALAGWAVVTLGWLQIVAGLGRGSKGGPGSEQVRGDHYDMTRHRTWFERIHKGLGWLSVLGAAGVIALGLQLADAPRWMALALVAWWALLGGAAWHWQRQGRCVDTYQAIWGADPQHPGNHLKPIGWGIRRAQP